MSPMCLMLYGKNMTSDHYKVLIEASVERDLDEIFNYICNDLHAPEAAKGLFIKLRENISALSTFPFRHTLIAEEPFKMIGIRKIQVENYTIFYTVNEEPKTVKVLRILYYRREWQMLI